jgi:hypothetical protein
MPMHFLTRKMGGFTHHLWSHFSYLVRHLIKSSPPSATQYNLFQHLWLSLMQFDNATWENQFLFQTNRSKQHCTICLLNSLLSLKCRLTLSPLEGFLRKETLIKKYLKWDHRNKKATYLK